MTSVLLACLKAHFGCPLGATRCRPFRAKVSAQHTAVYEIGVNLLDPARFLMTPKNLPLEDLGCNKIVFDNHLGARPPRAHDVPSAKRGSGINPSGKSAVAAFFCLGRIEFVNSARGRGIEGGAPGNLAPASWPFRCMRPENQTTIGGTLQS